MKVKNAAIVDDDDEVLDLIEQILKEEGLGIKRFNSAEQLLDVLPTTSFDVIISDLMLPGMSGLDLLDEIHLMGYRIPFVLITGYVSLESAIDAVNRGAFYYIKKPFNMEEIRFVINKLEQQADILEEIRQLKEQVTGLKIKLEEEPDLTLRDRPRQTCKASPYDTYDINKVFAAIEHLGKLRSEGHITEEEFGEYRGKLLKRIV